MLKGMDFYHLPKNIKVYNIQLLDTGLDSVKTTSEKVVYKRSEFLGNKFVDAVTNLYDDRIVKTKTVEQINIPPEEGEEILNELRQVI